MSAVVERLRHRLDARGVDVQLQHWLLVPPAMGNPEQVILDKLRPESWDVFIGVLWHRFGTATGNTDGRTGLLYGGGTEEEFRLSWQLWKSVGRPHVMFYRCTRPADPGSIDATQLAAVNRFFDDFAAHGEHPGLVRTYATGEEFSTYVHDHLLDFLDRSGVLTAPSTAAVGAVPSGAIPRTLPDASQSREDRPTPALQGGTDASRAAPGATKGFRRWTGALMIAALAAVAYTLASSKAIIGAQEPEGKVTCADLRASYTDHPGKLQWLFSIEVLGAAGFSMVPLGIPVYLQVEVDGTYTPPTVSWTVLDYERARNPDHPSRRFGWRTGQRMALRIIGHWQNGVAPSPTADAPGSEDTFGQTRESPFRDLMVGAEPPVSEAAIQRGGLWSATVPVAGTHARFEVTVNLAFE